MLRLSANDTLLDVNPDVAGAIFRLTRKGQDVLRPAVTDTTDALLTSCFPLVPFCNRIRNGEFVVEGHKVKLLPNLGNGHPHPLHGQGWRNAWKVIEAGASRAVLSYRHMPDDWPWEYEATSLVTLCYECHGDLDVDKEGARRALINIFCAHGATTNDLFTLAFSMELALRVPPPEWTRMNSAHWDEMGDAIAALLRCHHNGRLREVADYVIEQSNKVRE